METRYLVYTNKPFLSDTYRDGPAEYDDAITSIVAIVKTEEQALQMVKENYKLCYKSIIWIE